jgi:hypothetical protein
MTSLQQRQSLIDSIAEATTAGTRQDQACAVLGLSPRTFNAGRPMKPWGKTSGRSGNTLRRMR